MHRILSSLLTLPLLSCLMTQACAVDPSAIEEPCEKCDEQGSDFALEIPLSESPSGGADFDFCVKPNHVVNLTNAAWLAWMSTNEYAHFGAFGPALLELGFGGPADSVWLDCGRDFQLVEDAVASATAAGARLDIDDIQGGGACFDEFAEVARFALGGDNPDPALIDRPLDEFFSAYLLKSHHPEKQIQFFTGQFFQFGSAIFDGQSTQAMWAEHNDKKVITVAFRGTQPDKIEDIEADIALKKIDPAEHGWGSGWGLVHEGFLRSYLAVDENMLLERLKNVPDGYELWVTGHSLGGALATVFASRVMDLVDRGELSNIRLRGVYTIGKPRVGDVDFIDKFDDATLRHNVNVVRFRNGNDLVTFEPKGLPGINGGLYRHEGELVLIETEEEEGQSPQSEVYYGDDIPLRGFASLRDHGSKRYYGGLAGFSGFPDSGLLNNVEATDAYDLCSDR